MAKAEKIQLATDWREWVDEPGMSESPALAWADPGPLPKVEIKSKEDADLALKAIGDTDRTLVVINEMMEAAVSEARKDAVEEAAVPLKWKKALEKALEKYAEKEKPAWEGRTLVLNFGKLFFHKGSGAIRFARSVEYVLNAIKAKGWKHLIRKVEEPNKDAMGALAGEQLKEIGCKREKEDRFHYEVFKPEVK